MASKTKIREKSGSTVRSRLEAHDVEQMEWRTSVTSILAGQTEILKALREDFKSHEVAEANYQEKIQEFMLATTAATAAAKEKSAAVDQTLTTLNEHHTKVMGVLDKINQKVWLAIGAVMVYGPLLSFLGVEVWKLATGVVIVK